MITSAAQPRVARATWRSPTPRAAGLPIPSVIRTAKIATIDTVRAEPRGRIATKTLAEVRAETRAPPRPLTATPALPEPRA